MNASKPLSEDIEVAKRAFEKDDFETANILGNRILSNAVFLKAEEQKRFLLSGFFVKDVATEMMRVSAIGKTASVASAKGAVTPYLAEIISLLENPTPNIELFWTTYEKYANRIRKFGNLEIEDAVYTENKDFSQHVTRWLLDYLEKEKHLLFDSRNLLIEGLLNELGRVYRSHGAGARELMILSVLGYMQKTYTYIRLRVAKRDEPVDEDRVKREIFPYVEFITSPLKREQLSEATEKLCELILAWRLYFIRYWELPSPPPTQAERGVQLPDETRKKITEAITKSLTK